MTVPTGSPRVSPSLYSARPNMQDLPRRPVSIWITQILILLLGVAIGLVAVAASFRDLRSIATGDLTLSTAIWVLLSIIFRLAILSLFALAFWGLVQRKRYGRWLAVGVILLLVTMSIVGQITRPSGPLEYYEYRSPAEQVGGIFGTMILYGLFGLLLYHLIFSDSVNDFFDPPDTETRIDAPPPPETYAADPASQDRERN